MKTQKNKRVVICNKCGKEKSSDDFEAKRKVCRKCRSNQYKAYYLKNRKKRLEYHKQYRSNHIDEIKKREKEYEKNRSSDRKEYRKEYYRKNKDIIAEKKKEYAKHNRKKLAAAQRDYRKNIKNRIASNIRSRIYYAIREKSIRKPKSSIKALGCTAEELVLYLEGKFEPGMTWDNYGSDWHIDHIKPLAWFDLADANEFDKACHYTNLQPLWAESNWSKGARHDG